ncbi:hypothetical protein RM533_13115 [Croceicoccus sp. F390]|uniref:Transposase IS4-like domain-containing protein n=1 Tax=Croceicoccus esteveae TaxID=3075597 RepID=A0ABU2ZKG8_9SPHN|nr:hypothetical protein [Croceicoccus sp. F390]MDT0577106.1 hypothetical protein [Croceicoccus sp. F390]
MEPQARVAHRQGRPAGFILTGGVSDFRAVPKLLDLPVKPPKALLADKGYDSDAVCKTLLLHNILPVTPEANRRPQMVTAPCRQNLALQLSPPE